MDAFNPHSAGQYIGNYRNSFSGGCGIRRESSDSGYLMSLPESRRDSEVDGFNALGYRSGVPADLRRDSEDFFQQQLKVSCIYGKKSAILFIIKYDNWTMPNESLTSRLTTQNFQTFFAKLSGWISWKYVTLLAWLNLFYFERRYEIKRALSKVCNIAADPISDHREILISSSSNGRFLIAGMGHILNSIFLYSWTDKS